jgi:hypothetical protein
METVSGRPHPVSVEKKWDPRAWLREKKNECGHFMHVSYFGGDHA